jgi:polysaccharide export outer membrane protein
MLLEYEYEIPMTKSNSRCNFVQIVSAVPLILILLAIAAIAEDNREAGSQPESAEIAASSSMANLNAQAAPTASRAHEARISPGDVVDVKIFGLPEMSQELRVSNAGIIVLPMIGPLTAQGLTTSELEQKIAAALRTGGFLNDPQVNVSAKELRSSGVSVSGEVGKPGIYPVYGSCSLSDLIMVAGGLTPKSGHIVTVTHRDQPNTPVSVDISSTSVKTGQNVAVFSGDTVVVAKAGVVYVLGDVGHPAGFVMEGDEQMTVLQALASAGGTNKDAKIKAARIIRRSPQGIQELPVPLKEILSAQKQDMELRAGDVLFIPSRNSEGFWRGENSILQAAMMLAVFHP